MTPSLAQAIQRLDAHEPIVYPTDTLWGLGARVNDEAAVQRVFELKKRPFGQPMSIAVASTDKIGEYGVVTDLALQLMDLLPGPLTLVLERKPTVPLTVTGGQPSIGLRVPAHAATIQLLEATGPLTTTSANLHGMTEPKTPQEIEPTFPGTYIHDVPPRPIGTPSTVVDARGPKPVILRQGRLSSPDIEAALHRRR